MLVLESARLIIKPFEKNDAPKIQELANNEELASILGLPYPYTLQFAENWVAAMPALIASGDEYPLAILHKQTNKIIGTITLRIDKKNNKAELGYWMGRAYWGAGFMTEAVKRMVQFGFQALQLHKITAIVLTRNLGSVKVLEKAGLKREGLLRQHRFLLNKYEDVYVYGILREE
ncbi:GNAT family N-acetyltransferase [Caldibacillus lycopersici]|uniref:GNAT family N-acetyltransferase n=1 Tax=Perspicuibacillus lycopersici TaxID=1325689 RepID=A0AAE3ITC8_9BACI|nr:GNAT family protein [Perspicuibacillus lycopersici]MCU9613101.1 GNAT family N-acetyltransferase [Perspicuibacillus lycopersici]